MTVVAFIPVKGTSSRLPGKNWLPFNGSTLIQDKIRELRKVEQLTEVVVSTDSPLLAELAHEEGARVINRPTRFADESEHISQFVKYVGELFDDADVLWACATSPNFRAPEFREFLECWADKKKSGFDSILTVLKFQHFMMDEAGPLNFGRGNEGRNSENLPEWFVFTNGATVTPAPLMREEQDRIGLRPYYFEIGPLQATDIDYQSDYEVALAIHAWKESNQRNEKPSGKRFS